MMLPTPECFEAYDRRDQITFIYAALFTIAGDEALLDPSCFGGLDQRDQLTAIYDAVVSAFGDVLLDVTQPDGVSLYLQPDGVSVYQMIQ